MKHTPGNWKSAESFSGKLLIVVENEPGLQQAIAEIHSKPAHKLQDAMLLRAAPDMYCELIRTIKTIEAQYEDGVPEWVRLIAQRSLEAIAKAKGWL